MMAVLALVLGVLVLLALVAAYDFRVQVQQDFDRYD